MNNSSGEESRRAFYGWVVVGVAFLAQLLTYGLVYSFGVFFKPMAEEFGWSITAIAGVFSSYALVHTFLAPVAGKLADRFGPRLIVITGGFCGGLTMLLMSQVTALWQVYLLYTLIFSLP